MGKVILYLLAAIILMFLGLTILTLPVFYFSSIVLIALCFIAAGYLVWEALGILEKKNDP